MDESQKPFACTIEGCEMTFTNEDHLNWHHKKHDMVLNLGLANKNSEVADQTPTPTRFIRNCEEVGLFQDLQNVNPFDETFKKAIESGKSGTLHVPDAASNDDTLHTPHIFPPVESTSTRYISARSDHSTPSNGFCITSVPANQSSNEPSETYDLTIDDTDEPVTDNTQKSKHNELKNKLKETIKNKAKPPAVITPVPLEKLQLKNSEPAKITQPEPANKTKPPEPAKRTSLWEKDDPSKRPRHQVFIVSDDKEKIRETNRAAQFRCRKRKQMMWNSMEEELKNLRNENARLHYENQNFRHKLMELLLEHKKTNNTTIVARIEEILTSSVAVSRKDPPSPVQKVPITVHKAQVVKSQASKPPVIPMAVIHNPGQGVQKPVLIQVLGSVGQVAVSVLPK